MTEDEGAPVFVYFVLGCMALFSAMLFVITAYSLP